MPKTKHILNEFESTEKRVPMAWHERDDTCVEFRISTIEPALTPERLAEIVGWQPSESIAPGDTVWQYRDPLPRQKPARRPARFTDCTFSSHALIDSPDVTEHIKAILRFFETRLSELRQIGGRRSCLESKIIIRHSGPAETQLDLGLLTRLHSLGTTRGINFTFELEDKHGRYGEKDEEKPEKDIFYFSYFLAWDRDNPCPFEDREYRFEYVGDKNIYGMDECSYCPEDDFRAALINTVHGQRGLITPLLACGYRGTFRLAWDYGNDFRWDYLSRESLDIMSGVADRVVFAFVYSVLNND